MPKARSLKDLYIRGKVVVITDPWSGTSEQVWAQKLNPVERDTVIREADKARSVAVAGQYNIGSEFYLAALADIEAMSREAKVTLLVNNEARTFLDMAREEVGTAEEWANEDYLQGLQDAWKDGLSTKFINDAEDAEAKRVSDELQRYLDQVKVNLDNRLEEHRALLSSMNMSEVNEASLRLDFQLRGQAAWVAEYQQAELWQAVRWCSATDGDDGNWDHTICDHSQLAMPKRVDVDTDLQEAPRLQLLTVLQELTVDPLEGKDSPVTPAS